MSTTPLDLPVLISQLPYVARVAHVEMASPEMQKDIYGPLINAHIQNARKKIQEVEETEHPDAVDRDGHQAADQQQAHTRKHEEEDLEEEVQETEASSSSPWSGNIVNVKV